MWTLWFQGQKKMLSFKKKPASITARERGFSLAEVLAALVILTLVSSSVLLVIHNNASAASDLTIRMRAFEIARENMEKLLALNTVSENIEYGVSEIYPDIQWQTTVEAFREPIYSKTWIQAICSAEYLDTKGQTQTVELTHWITQLTDQQAKMLNEYKKQQENSLLQSGQIIQDIAEAAAYVGVDVDTIRQWQANGMRMTKEGYYLVDELELYEWTNGNPTMADRREAQQSKAGYDQTQDLLDETELDELMMNETDDSENPDMATPGASELQGLEIPGL
jgi:prepilin-type N-terminal cleavage/methylation domain-containing protein